MVNWKRKNDFFKNFTEKLTQEWIAEGFNKKDASEWLESGLRPEDAKFTQWLREEKNFNSNYFFECNDNEVEKLREEHASKNPSLKKSVSKVKDSQKKDIVDPKKWLDTNYPEEKRNEITDLEHVGNIKGDLIIEKWENLEKITLIPYIYIISTSKKTKKNSASNSSNELHKNKSHSENNNLLIVLKNLPKLRYLTIKKQRLKWLFINNCPQLQELNLSDNYLRNLEFIDNLNHPENLIILNIDDNEFTKKDLFFLTRFKNLEELNLGNNYKSIKQIKGSHYNRFYGSLEPLKFLTKLKKLNISTTDISHGLEYLPNSLEKFSCRYNKEIPNAKVKKIHKLLSDRGIVEDDLEYIKNFSEKFRNIRKKPLMKEEPNGIKKNNLHNKITIEAIKQLKGIENHRYSTKEKELLIEQLIPDSNLRERYNKYGLCKDCEQPNTGNNYCQICRSEYFRHNFGFWTSSNYDIDKFIQESQLKATKLGEVLNWVPYENFTNVEYIAEGGFGKVFKAKWKVKGYRSEINDIKDVALKKLNHSRDIKKDFIREVFYYNLFDYDMIVRCFGISRCPSTKDYIIVMQYIENGSLRKHLNKIYSRLGFAEELSWLIDIIKGLIAIHKEGLIHRDLHSGNILSGVVLNDRSFASCFITDLGLCRPANETDKGKIYGVLPYIAPEVLRSLPFTQASDIYSFGIIAYEILTGLPPYCDIPHTEFLATKICEGTRPKFNIKIPPLLEELIKKCWDAEPKNRPTAISLHETLFSWLAEINDKKDTEFYQQYEKTEKVNELSNYKTDLLYKLYKIHPEAIYASRKFYFENLSSSKNSKENSLEDLRISDSKEFGEEKDREICQLQEEIILKKFNIYDDSDCYDWKENHLDFTSKLINQWQNNNFTTQQYKEWLDIGLKPTDANFCTWLRDIKRVDSEWVLNYGNLKQLNQEFFNWLQSQQQTQIQIPPK